LSRRRIGRYLPCYCYCYIIIAIYLQSEQRLPATCRSTWRPNNHRTVRFFGAAKLKNRYLSTTVRRPPPAEFEDILYYKHYITFSWSLNLSFIVRPIITSETMCIQCNPCIRYASNHPPTHYNITLCGNILTRATWSVLWCAVWAAAQLFLIFLCTHRIYYYVYTPYNNFAR